ncbi:MAG TPA: Fe-S-containing protein [Acidobacteriaceae bacterium]|jgi:FTR1 family protein|nr:Fe-S-containing protein [Acidobacteriaceae bacterium]
MLQAFIITLREGVEAALIIGIVFAYLNKIGRHDLKRVVLAALAAACIASLVVAIILSRIQFNEDMFEGIIMLVAAVFVLSMIWFMQHTAKTMKGHIEKKLGALTGSGSKTGLFLFVFLMVFREGVETVLILGAVSLNSTELMSFFGTLLGVTCAVVFGVLFVKGSVRINLQRFFRVTSVILYFVVFQLLISGLHELSEYGILPSSRTEMRIIGPIVSNDSFFFITILALAGLMVLFEYRKRAAQTTLATNSGTLNAAERRKAEWSARRERLWMTAVYTCSFVFIFLITAQFIYAKSTTALSPAAPVTLTGSQVTVPVSQVQDDQLHRYVVNVNGTDVRFLLFRRPDGKIVSVADACQICGPVGFYKSGNNIICKLCASPLTAQSMGQPGGCNPVPLQSTIAGGFVIITAHNLEALVPTFSK